MVELKTYLLLPDNLFDFYTGILNIIVIIGLF